ncbi:MAG: hypothetical protein IT371_04665 [Deltaproteobacteria bacterium]|nr:hypothetical protein [Deltaproteobacteria bacterium]
MPRSLHAVVLAQALVVATVLSAGGRPAWGRTGRDVAHAATLLVKRLEKASTGSDPRALAAKAVLSRIQSMRDGAPLATLRRDPIIDALTRHRFLSPKDGCCELLFEVERQAMQEGTPARLRRVLEEYARTGARPDPSVVDPTTGKVMNLLDARRFLLDGGHPQLAGRLTRQVRSLCLGAGTLTELERALDAPVTVLHRPDDRWNPIVRLQGPARPPRKSVAPWRDRRANGYRDVGGNARYWWGSSQAGYLDLMYRKLPVLLRQAHASGRRSLRLFSVGADDLSLPLALLSMAEDAAERLAKDPTVPPALARFLRDELQIEVVTSDVAPHYALSGDRLSIGGGLLLEEVSQQHARGSRRTIQSLEKRHATTLAAGEPEDRGYQKALLALASAGKVRQLFGRHLKLTAEVALRPSYSGFGSPFGDRLSGASESMTLEHFGGWPYRVDRQGLTVVDTLTKSSRPRRAARSQLRIVKQDITARRPDGRFDAVVCTDVLPWLQTYNQGNGRQSFDAALSNLLSAAREDGVIVVDATTRQMIREVASPSVRDALQRSSTALLFTSGDRPLQAVFSDTPKAPEWWDYWWRNNARAFGLDPYARPSASAR